ncbi:MULTISPECIES: tetratricopeptide repeat protein [unclassified Coleofasciculus]|uniref:tetratricopeptide repeat protein n=1 Tax=unclassified Coleofasciculus TaxID=2692782 RepID=UPI0018810D3E|nr:MULTISPECIES: tetratricopeptide repeat protein [unclassified Coleofasciculus]MBE9128963.1 tetratricopeptide repeat protein [Coleofasciculus sp. LEGE 07081]MBE9151699.1 tetratricopeptide repeat protein [Coleofasciculus sp. LEGE 07092]
MRSRPKHFGFITVTLLLSLTSPLLAVTPNFKPVKAQAQTAQDRQAEIDQLLEEAKTQFREGLFGNSEVQRQNALESFQQILSIYRELGYRRQERDLTFMIGEIYGYLGQYDQSLKSFQQVLAIDRELGDHCQEQETVFKISSVYGVRGRYDQVLEGLEKSIAINKELDEPCGKPYFFLLKDISNVYNRLGHPDQALKTLEQLLAFNRKVGDHIEEQSILLNISEIYEQQKQYEQALQFYQQVLAISRELAVSKAAPQEGLSPVREPYILTRIGAIYEQQGNYEQALKFYQQALTINRKSNGSGVATLITLSRVYQRLGQYEQGLESYQQALAVNRKESSGSSENQSYPMSLTRQYIFMSLSQVYRKLGQNERAQDSSQQALAIGKKIGNFEPSIRALNDWGSIQAINRQFPEALETFEKALAFSKEVALELDNSCSSAYPKVQNLGVSTLYSSNFGARNKCGGFMDQSSLEGAETLILKNLGFVYQNLSQPEKSRESYEQALRHYQQEFAKLKESDKICWLQEELKIPRAIAQVYEILGEDNLAQGFYRQAEKLEFVQDVKGVVCAELGEVASGIVLTDDDDSSPPKQRE